MSVSFQSRFRIFYLLLVVISTLGVYSLAFADHTPTPTSAALAGSMQSELGCPGDWQPECPLTELTANGPIWEATFFIPAGSWEYKIALNDSWAESYGDGGGNILLVVESGGANVTFTYDHITHLVSDSAAPPPLVQPAAVTVAGSLQDELGCSGDWQPDCSATYLGFDPDDGVWQQVFNIPAGNFEYKATIDNSWTENYGQNATQGGSNIPLNLSAETTVKFYYDHASNWITDNQNAVIATLPGNIQALLGCPGDWQPDCLRTWLQDTDGDGIYYFSTKALPAGNYEVKVAHNESWDENYGVGGVPGGSNYAFTILADNDLVTFTYDPVTHILTIGGDLPVGNISEAHAYWLSEDTIAWGIPAGSAVKLYFSDDASLATTPDGLTGGDYLELSENGVIGGEIAEKFRHLAGLPAFKIANSDLDLVKHILKQQFAVSAEEGDGEAIDATGVQPAGVLDDLFTFDGDLGVTYAGSSPLIRVWAPTARSVNLHVFDDSNNNYAAMTIVPMVEDSANGTWSVEGGKTWNRKYYLYEVEVFARSTGQIETNLVTDPYSLNLSMDSKRSQIINLSDDDLKPKHWAKLRKPALAAPEDIALYELHVRDFSISDSSVPKALRGTFAAFAQPNSRGAGHLRSLSKAGLTHVHLLPSFDCATIPEDRSTHLMTGDLSGFAPDSTEQQAAVDEIRGEDGFNWCYDPYHYTSPEGSYSTDPDGVARIVEFREMVSGLNKLGLRVVMDVVYNHTSGSLQGEKSVLDKIVPDYYHRLNSAGFIESSSCCSNTATEHNMMEKLMIDSLLTWASEYKVDGFRFDLMGHHTKVNIEKARDTLQALTMKEDGVDGSAIYLYGEGWNFGEVANNARFEQATQANMGDNTGVGSFNDRMRDGVRGGGPFDSGIDHVRRQGFINGLYYDPNSENSGSQGELDELLRLTEWIRLGLVGTLSDYTFIDRYGNPVLGSEMDYFGNPGAGYTSDPQEIINYAAAHDNETLFDISQYKLPLGTDKADRVRVANLANSIIVLSQGIPLLHAGQDMLRSKSMDRNSYDSGDWFNILDFSYKLNGWGRGLPLFGDNQNSWAEASILLADPALAVETHDIRSTNHQMRELLRIRNSSKLFRLRTADEIIERVVFHNTGPDQVPGLVVMSLRGDDGVEIVVLFNASTGEQSFSLEGEGNFALHPIQQDSIDPVVGTSSFDANTEQFYVPARTTAVFVRQ